MPKCIPTHSSSSRAGAGKGRGSCLSYCIIPHPSRKPAFPVKILIVWHGHADGKMLGPRLLQVAFFFIATYLFCSAHLACGWRRAAFSVFIYSSINTAQPCHAFPLAGGTAWQDSCLQHITVQQAPPKCRFLSEPVAFSLQPSPPITFNPLKITRFWKF